MDTRHFLRYKFLTIRILILAISILTPFIGFGQFFDSDQNPPSVKFRQLNTPNFQIIYPTLLESEAQRMANTLDTIINKVAYSIGKKPRKISIILQNQSTLSNGFVQLAPRRSEFFTTPPQEFDFQDWLNSLAVHELRHVVQFDKLTGTYKKPFFEELALAIFGITLPPWFFEGDAVNIETALTTAGRGKSPDFGMEFRANVLSGRRFSYSKDYFGSFKDITPGYYELGHHMVAKLRRDNSPLILDSIFERMRRNPVRPYNLSNTIKKFAGVNSKALHAATVEELNNFWESNKATGNSIEYKPLNQRPENDPTNYYLPVELPDGKILCIKSSKGKLATFTLIDSFKNEHSLIKTGFQYEPNYKYAAGKIVWDETRADLRFQKRSFSIINIYDIAKRKYKQLSHYSRYFSPALSPDGNTILAVEVQLDNSARLIELDANTGKILKFYPPQGYMIQNPSFNPKGNKAVFTAVSQDGKAIYELNRETGKFHELLSPQKQLISRPIFANGKVVFKAHYNGIDNIYELDTVAGSLRPLTDTKFGAFNPSFSSKTGNLIFNNYQYNGHDIALISLKQAPQLKLDQSATYFSDPIKQKEQDTNVFDSIPNTTFASKKYGGAANLFYFHSVEPIAEENDYFNDYNFGLRMVSNNKLNTLDFYTGFRFNRALQAGEYLAGFTYKKFFPVFDVSYLNQARLTYVRPPNAAVFPVSWRENVLEGSVSIPVSFNRLNQVYRMGLKISTGYTSRYNVSTITNNFDHTLKFPLLTELSINRNSRASSRDIAPRFGQNISLSYRSFPFDNDLSGDFFTFKSVFLFPGVQVNHSLLVSFNYQSNSGVYQGLNDIPKVSGYNNLNDPAAVDNTLLLRYRLPLFYPDWEIGPLAYIKRFRGGFFADFENVRSNNITGPRTYGLELTGDMNLLRFYLPNFALTGKLILVNGNNMQNPIFEAGFNYTY